MNKTVDLFLVDGCGRCKFYQTDNCKVHSWKQELVELRQIALSCGLIEEIKWGFPCYTHKKKNIISIAPFRNHASINFFKGILIEDPSNLLKKAGENSHSMRIIPFTSVLEIEKIKLEIIRFIKEAVKIEESGKKTPLPKAPMPSLPNELKTIFNNDKVFHECFKKLTPGRQRGYILFFSSAKQSKTIIDRINKFRDRILEGYGMHD